MRKAILSLFLAGSFVPAAFCPVAMAHGGADLRLKISVTKSQAWVETSLNTQFLLGYDTDDNGELSIVEYEAQYSEIAKMIDAKLSLATKAGDVLPTYFSDTPIVDRDHIGPGGGVEYIKVLRRWNIPPGTEELILTSGISGSDPDMLVSRGGNLKDVPALKTCTRSYNMLMCR